MKIIFKTVYNFFCMLLVALVLSLGTSWIGYALTYNPYVISWFSLEDIYEESEVFNNLSDENLKRSSDSIQKNLKEIIEQNNNRIEHEYVQQRFIILLLSIAFALLFLFIRRFINQVIVYNGIMYSVLFTLLGGIEYFAYPLFFPVFYRELNNPLTSQGFFLIAIPLFIFMIIGELIKKYFLKIK